MSQFLPRSFKEFHAAVSRKQEGVVKYCSRCGQYFGDDNTHSPEAWEDTQRYKICEDCSDALED